MEYLWVWITLILVVFAVVILVALCRRKRVKGEIKGPCGLGLRVEADDGDEHSQPGAKIENAVSRDGGIVADDRTGHGAEIKNADAKTDIRATSKSSEPPCPKA